MFVIDAKWQRALAPNVTVSVRKRTNRQEREGLGNAVIYLQLRNDLVDLITFTSFIYAEFARKVLQRGRLDQ